METSERNNRLQAYLDEITESELDRFPELSSGGETNETGRQNSMIARLFLDLYPILYSERKLICPKPTQPVEEKTDEEKDKIRRETLAKILGLETDELPLRTSLPSEKLKTRLERTFVAVNLFFRIFDDQEERMRNLTFPRPELRGKSPINAMIAGKTDEVLYFAAMSARHSDVLG